MSLSVENTNSPSASTIVESRVIMATWNCEMKRGVLYMFGKILVVAVAHQKTRSGGTHLMTFTLAHVYCSCRAKMMNYYHAAIR